MPVFITLEGLDGSGKTTQVQLLAEYLRERQRDFVLAREPGGTAIGEKIRELLLGLRNEMTVHSEAFLFAAARAELVVHVLRPALAMGRSIICDRYVDSSVAYQAYGGGLPVEFVLGINEMGTGGLRPHRTLVLDLEPAAALARRSGGKQNRLDRKELDFYQRVREGYLDLADAEPRRVMVVNADRPLAEVQADIRGLVDEIWPRPRSGAQPAGG